MGRLLTAAILFSAPLLISAQTPGPALEAAAIKVAPPGSAPMAPGAWAPPTSTSARLRPSTLRTLVMYAFDIDPRRRDPEPVGGPPWIDRNLYQLTLKFTALPTVPQAKALIRGLLEDRFKLRWHYEKREVPVYALVPARPDGRLGPGLQPSRIDCRAYSETLLRTGRGAVAREQGAECGLTSGGAAGVASLRGLRRQFPAGAQLIAGSATMTELVTAMLRADRETDRPIVDRTGLTGTYDIELWWVPFRSGFVTAADPAEVMPLQTAVEPQLGLKLESRREAVDAVVIDSADLPMTD